MTPFTLPGGLVDAHFHAALDFEDRGLSRERLIEVNLAALRRAGVLAARDVGQPPDAPGSSRASGSSAPGRCSRRRGVTSPA